MESKFTGSGLGFVGWALLKMLLAIPSMFTFGIVGAWGTMAFHRWLASHTYIDGRQLRFDGGTMEFWVRRIIWAILIIVTLTIYLWFFFPARKRHWFTARTHVNTPAAAN